MLPTQLLDHCDALVGGSCQPVSPRFVLLEGALDRDHALHTTDATRLPIAGPRCAAPYARAMSQGRIVGSAIVTGGAVVTLTGTFLGWVRSGSSARSSYDVFALVDRLGFSPNGVVGSILRVWPLVPLMLVVGVIGQWSHARRRGLRVVLAALPVFGLLFAGGTAMAIANAPEAGLFAIGPGPNVTAAGAVVMLAGVVVSGVVARRERVGGSAHLRPDPASSSEQHILQDERPVGHDAVDTEIA